MSEKELLLGVCLVIYIIGFLVVARKVCFSIVDDAVSQEWVGVDWFFGFIFGFFAGAIWPFFLLSLVITNCLFLVFTPLIRIVKNNYAKSRRDFT